MSDQFSGPDPDAAVRALIEGSHVPLGTRGWQLVREAFAAGRALGHDEGAREEREAIRKLVAGFDEDVDFDGQELLDDINIAISHRGKEGK